MNQRFENNLDSLMMVTDGSGNVSSHAVQKYDVAAGLRRFYSLLSLIYMGPVH